MGQYVHLYFSWRGIGGLMGPDLTFAQVGTFTVLSTNAYVNETCPFETVLSPPPFPPDCLLGHVRD